MLLIPAFCAAILARQWRWAEVWTLGAAWCVFLAKDWLIVLARQRWVWKEFHLETTAARRALIGSGMVLALCGLCLVRVWPLWVLGASAAGVGGFMALTVAMNVKNRQRSTLFQISSAVTLSATSLAMCLSATGAIQPWCWWLWLLNSAQATAGILVVHSRLERRIAARRGALESGKWGPAHVACVVLLCGAWVTWNWWIVAALLLASAGYLHELRRQENVESLQMPLTRVGLQALALSVVYSLLIVAGLWRTY